MPDECLLATVLIPNAWCVTQVVERMKLALKVDEAERASRKARVDGAWQARAAAEVELGEEDAGVGHGKKRRKKRGGDEDDDDEALRRKRVAKQEVRKAGKRMQSS